MENSQYQAENAAVLSCPSSIKWGSWIVFAFSSVAFVLMLIAWPTDAQNGCALVIFIALVEAMLKMVLAILTMMGRLWAYVGLIVLVALGLIITAIVSQGKVAYNATLTVIVFMLLIARYNDYIAFARGQQNIHQSDTTVASYK